MIPSCPVQRRCLESGAPWLQKTSGDKLCRSTFVSLPLSQMEGSLLVFCFLARLDAHARILSSVQR